MAKKLLNTLPELYILISIVFYWISSTVLNPLAIILLGLALYLIYSKNKYLGLGLGIVIMFLSLFLSLAILSDIVNEKSTSKMITIGFTYIILNLFFSVWMLTKYSKSSIK